MATSDGSGLASSLTDLMTSLAVIFVLLLVASLNNLRTSDTRNQVLLKLQDMLREFASKGVTVEEDRHDPLLLLVLVPEKDLLEFDFDKADIKPGGVAFLERFSPRLSETVCAGQFKDDINSIIVEGHADSRGTDSANLERSQQRSSAVVIRSLAILQALESQSATPSTVKDCFRRLTSASGRGSADPVLDETGREDSDRSRRVVFKIRIRSLEEREIRSLVRTTRSGAVTP